MKLDEDGQITYLANAIFLASADGRLTPKKAAALDEIRAQIGAKKRTFDIATKKALSGTYAPQKLDSFVAEASNLADLMYISIIDGAISDSAKKLIAEFSKMTELTNDQLALLSKEAIARIKGEELSSVCPSCKAKVTGDSSYCPKCGAALKPGPTDTEYQIPDAGYAIEFCESTAAGFPAALKFAQTAPSFQRCLRNRKMWYLAAWPETAFQNVVRLAELLSGIRNRKCYYNKGEVPWDEVFGFVWCAEERSKAYRPIEYCFGKDENRLNPWGCKQARLEWTEWAPWFSYGRFEKTTGVFRKESIFWSFDKERILHELMTNLHRFRYCPYLRVKLIETVLHALPDKVEITNKGPWKYNQSDEQVPGSIKIVELNKSDGVEFKNEYYADGVRPRGLNFLEEILRKAFADAGISDVKASELMC